MKLPNIKILREKNKILKKVSADVVFPISDVEKKLIYDLITYLEMSQNDEYAEKYDLRPGMGMAFIQVGIPKRIFVIANEDALEKGLFEEHIIINPKIISHSRELIYVGDGEGCLSIDRPTTGIIPRYARVTVDYQDIDGNKKTIRVREEIAVAFQHEIDHLNGILFVDRIDKKNPFKNKNEMRELYID